MALFLYSCNLLNRCTWTKTKQRMTRVGLQTNTCTIQLLWYVFPRGAEVYKFPALHLTGGHDFMPHMYNHNLSKTTVDAQKGWQPWLPPNLKGTQPFKLQHPKESLKHALLSPQALQTVLQSVKCVEPTYRQSRAGGICCIPWWGSQIQGGTLCRCSASWIRDPESTSWRHKHELLHGAGHIWSAAVFPACAQTNCIKCLLKISRSLKPQALAHAAYLSWITSTLKRWENIKLPQLIATSLHTQ